MTMPPRFPRKTPLWLALALALSPLPVLAQSTFPEPVEMAGRFRISAATPGKPIFAGSEVIFDGQGFAPGQSVVLQRGTLVLNADAPLVADAEGKVSFTFTLPADAALGVHPVVALADGPSSTAIVDLKVSPDVALTGADGFAAASVKSPAPGLYQAGYSARAKAVFVAASTFRPTGSSLLKLDPATLQVVAQTTPPPMADELRKPAAADAPPATPDAPAAVFGVGVDDARGHVWVTNTLLNTVAVYAQDDLSLVRQFPEGQVYHAREVLVDQMRGLAYVTSSATAKVHVFDAVTLEPVTVIEIASAQRGGEFSVMNMALDGEGGRLFVASRVSNELAVIDVASNTVAKIIELPGARQATGLAWDAVARQVYVAAQNSDNLMIVDPETGTVLHDVAVGAGALSVEFDASQRLAYVVNRGAGTVTVVSPEGQIVANMDLGSYPNDVATDGQGGIYVVNKSLGEDDTRGDMITLIRRK